MKTRVTELFGIKYPILLSGMSWISVPRMVAAVSNAGGLGILATSPMNTEMTRAAVREIRFLTDKPFWSECHAFLSGGQGEREGTAGRAGACHRLRRGQG